MDGFRVTSRFSFTAQSHVAIRYLFPVADVHPLLKPSFLYSNTIPHFLGRLGGLYGLPSNSQTRSDSNDYQYSCQNNVDESQYFGSTPRLRLFLGVLMEVGSLIVGCIGTGIFVWAIIHHNNRRRWIGGFLALVGYLGFCSSVFSLFIDRLPWEWWQWLHDDQKHSQCEILHGENYTLALPQNTGSIPSSHIS